MVAEVLSGMVQGVHGEIITVQADVSDGLPVFGLTGHLSSEVKEAKERVRTALKNTGCHLPPRRVSVNLAPADVRKSGTCYDMAIAVGIMTAMGLIPQSAVRGIVFLGELALDGMLSPVTGVLAILRTAQEAGYHTCVVPPANVQEASLLPEMRVLGFANLKEVTAFLRGTAEDEYSERKIVTCVKDVGKTIRAAGRPDGGAGYPDLSEVKGQRMAKRALEIAVAGYHNLFLDGPPGAGKIGRAHV